MRMNLQRLNVIVAICAAWFLVVSGVQAAAGDGAEVIGQTIPSAADMGSVVAAELTLKNVGTDAWTPERKIALEVKEAGNGKDWGITRIYLDADESIEPGSTKTFRFDMRIPDTAGDYLFSWALTLDGKPLPIQGADVVAVRVDDPVARATFVSQLLPDRVNPGERFRTLVQFRNDGRSSWNRAKGVKLAAIDPQSGKLWGLAHVDLAEDETVLPGNTATFAFHMTAPKKTGEYDMRWRMFQDGRQHFGEAGPTAAIFVGGGNNPSRSNIGTLTSEFVGQTVPTAVKPDQMFRVTVIFKNTGDVAWNPGTVTLMAQPPADNLLWLVDEVEMTGGRAVDAGAIKAFEFTVRAPAEPGTYPFVWRLYHAANGAFGDRSEMRKIQVAK